MIAHIAAKYKEIQGNLKSTPDIWDMTVLLVLAFNWMKNNFESRIQCSLKELIKLSKVSNSSRGASVVISRLVKH